jgi:hypothetical protein
MKASIHTGKGGRMIKEKIISSSFIIYRPFETDKHRPADSAV